MVRLRNVSQQIPVASLHPLRCWRCPIRVVVPLFHQLRRYSSLWLPASRQVWPPTPRPPPNLSPQLATSCAHPCAMASLQPACSFFNAVAAWDLLDGHCLPIQLVVNSVVAFVSTAFQAHPGSPFAQRERGTGLAPADQDARNVNAVVANASADATTQNTTPILGSLNSSKIKRCSNRFAFSVLMLWTPGRVWSSQIVVQLRTSCPCAAFVAPCDADFRTYCIHTMHHRPRKYCRV